MPKQKRALRVVSVAKPAAPKPKLTPYLMHQRVTYWHPKFGMYSGKVIEVNEQKDTYVVELHSGSTMGIEGSWIKTRRPVNG